MGQDAATIIDGWHHTRGVSNECAGRDWQKRRDTLEFVLARGALIRQGRGVRPCCGWPFRIPQQYSLLVVRGDVNNIPIFPLNQILSSTTIIYHQFIFPKKNYISSYSIFQILFIIIHLNCSKTISYQILYFKFYLLYLNYSKTISYQILFIISPITIQLSTIFIISVRALFKKNSHL